MFVPETAGGILVTGKNCRCQVTHNDFQVPGRKDMRRLPGYFMIINGKLEFPLWVSDHSHKFATRRFKHVTTTGKVLLMKKIVVQWHSVFVGHGHLTHAGAGDEDRVPDMRSGRYRIYIKRN